MTPAIKLHQQEKCHEYWGPFHNNHWIANGTIRYHMAVTSRESTTLSVLAYFRRKLSLTWSGKKFPAKWLVKMQPTVPSAHRRWHMRIAYAEKSGHGESPVLYDFPVSVIKSIENGKAGAAIETPAKTERFCWAVSCMNHRAHGLQQCEERSQWWGA